MAIQVMVTMMIVLRAHATTSAPIAVPTFVPTVAPTEGAHATTSAPFAVPTFVPTVAPMDVQTRIDHFCGVDLATTTSGLSEAAEKCHKECCAKSPKEVGTWEYPVSSGCTCHGASHLGDMIIIDDKQISPPFEPSKLEGKCLDAMCAYDAAVASGGVIVMTESMKAHYPDVPECCFEQMMESTLQAHSGLSCPGGESQTPSSASEKPSCMSIAACSTKMSMANVSSSSTCPPEDMAARMCSSTIRPHLTALIEALDTMARLQKSGDCNLGVRSSGDSSSSCGMLDLNPMKTLLFLCGSTNAGDKQLYCGDWVSNPDGQCSESASGQTHETCSLSSGPVQIHESECAGNAFLTKFAKGSGAKPHCGPLLRGGCCAGSLFFAMTDSDEASMWPLCVRTWATQTCGVDLTPCHNDEVESTFVVEVSMTITTTRRLGQSLNGCTNNEAKLLSGKMGGALAKTSAKAGAAGARPIVLSDSSCLDGGARGRTVVTSFVLQGSDAAARSQDVQAALGTSEFQSQLSAQGVQATNFTVKGLGTTAAATTTTTAAPTVAPTTSAPQPSASIATTSSQLTSITGIVLAVTFALH